MASSSFWVRREALFGLVLGTLPVDLMADPLTDVRCALADAAKLTAEANNVLRELTDDHASLLQAPAGWTCEQTDRAESEGVPPSSDLEFLCKRDSVKAIAKISGRASVDKMADKLKQAWPKTFRPNENVFRRGPWDLVIRDGMLFGTLDQSVSIEIVPAAGTNLSPKDLLDFIKTLNRIDQTVPDFEAYEDRHFAAIQALASLAPRLEAGVSTLLFALPSVESLEVLGFESSEDGGRDRSRTEVGDLGFTRSMPWALVTLTFPGPGTPPDPERLAKLSRCDAGVPPTTNEETCLKHGSFVYRLTSEETDLSLVKSRTAIVPIGSNGLLSVLTFGPKDGPMTADELTRLREGRPELEGDEAFAQAIGDLFLSIGAANDIYRFPRVVDELIDEFEAAGGARLDLDRFPIGEGECD